MKLIKEIKNLKNKKVLIRVDFNVPVGSDGIVDDKEDWRIKASLPTIKYLIEKEARIILIAHLGRPKGNQESRTKNQEYSLKPVANRLEELLGCRIGFINDCLGVKVKDAVEKIQAGKIILLENLRFYKEEKENDKEFAKELAGYGDLYINDAFSNSHRDHASVSAITKFLPSYAGFLLEKETRILSGVIKNPSQPATVIIGGAKTKTKLPVIKNLIDKFNHILVGGIVANVILKAKGIDTGKSFFDDVSIEDINKINLTDRRLHIPIDAVIYNPQRKEVSLSAIGNIKNSEIMDIGPDTRELYSKIIYSSGTVIWNGPIGMFEKKEFSFGTKAIVEAIVKSKGYTIIGGGETIAAVDKFGDLEKIDYVCTGGGAMLEFLSGNQLPGLKALE